MDGVATRCQRDFFDGFDTLGWGPDGKVRGRYKVTSTSTTDFLVVGECDEDGDGIVSRFTATKSINSTLVGR